jgi:hypothetical protein
VLKAACLASGTDVIIKRYIKKKMSSRAVHKMEREVRCLAELTGRWAVDCRLGGGWAPGERGSPAVHATEADPAPHPAFAAGFSACGSCASARACLLP